MNAMAARGHNITVLSVNEDPNPPPNVHYILIEKIYEDFFNEDDYDLIAMAEQPPVEAIKFIYTFTVGMCQAEARTKGLQTLLNYPADFKFDIILSDFAAAGCLLGFVHKFNYPPLVGFTAFNNPPYTARVVGGHNYYSYTPYFSTDYSNRMSFWQRVHNLWLYATDY